MLQSGVDLLLIPFFSLGKSIFTVCRYRISHVNGDCTEGYLKSLLNNQNCSCLCRGEESGLGTKKPHSPPNLYVSMDLPIKIVGID